MPHKSVSYVKIAGCISRVKRRSVSRSYRKGGHINYSSLEKPLENTKTPSAEDLSQDRQGYSCQLCGARPDTKTVTWPFLMRYDVDPRGTQLPLCYKCARAALLSLEQSRYSIQNALLEWEEPRYVALLMQETRTSLGIVERYLKCQECGAWEWGTLEKHDCQKPTVATIPPLSSVERTNSANAL